MSMREATALPVAPEQFRKPRPWRERYGVIEAADAAEAIGDFASGEAVGVVFSDVHLPGTMDGLGLTRWVHRHPRGVPVMLTSGYGDTTRVAALAESLATKPYRQKEVASRLLDGVRNRVS